MSAKMPNPEQVAQAAVDQLGAMQRVNANRGFAVLGIMLDGIQSVVAGARAGDRESRAIAKRIHGLWSELASIAAIELPSDRGD